MKGALTWLLSAHNELSLINLNDEQNIAKLLKI